MSIVLNWQKKLGYKKDPFVNEPTSELVGLEEIQERINLFLLREEKLILIKGEEGSGKSSILSWLKKELKNQHTLIIIDLRECSSREKIEATLLKQTTSLYRSLFNKETTFEDLISNLQKKQYIIAFEEPQLLTSAQTTLFDELLTKTVLRMIILGTNEQLKKNPLNTKAQSTITLPEYSINSLTKLLSSRIEAAGSVGTFPFQKQDIEDLAKKANNNPKQLLAHARDKAIELSLKNLATPQRVKEEITPQPIKKRETKGQEELVSALDEQEKKGFSFFRKIRFEITDEEQEDNKKRKEHKKHDDKVPEDVGLDAEELRKIVEGK